MKNSSINPILILAGILIVGAIVFKVTSPRIRRNVLAPAYTQSMRRQKITISSSRPIAVTPTPVPVITPKATPPPPPAPKKTSANQVIIANHDLMVEIADTDALRAQGLSGRASLGVNDGMLFIFQTPDQYAFWMKDMQFPLDFIWIYQGKVIQITPDAQPQPGVSDDQLTNYLSASTVDSVLEVNAGWAAKNDVQVGDSVVDQF